MGTRLVGLSGSLRAASLNTALLRAASARLPAGVDFELLDVGDLPVYNEDLGVVPAVERVRATLARADALLISTAEYNHSVSAPLKNVIDWCSRPAYASVLVDLPTGLLSASPSAVGGARAQQHLKAILLATCTPVFHGQELVVGQAPTKLVDGALVDERTASFLTRWLERFAAWAAAQPRRAQS